MSDILGHMLEADIIVLSSPVYFYSVSAQMKILIDRTVAVYSMLKDKQFYFIATAADANVHSLDRTIECFRGFIECLPNAKEAGIIYGAGVWQRNDVQQTNLIEQAYQMGKAIS